MRPNYSSNRFSETAADCNHGLPLSGGMGYNDRQNLPHVEARFELLRGLSLQLKAAMKPARPVSKPNSSTPAKHGAESAVESRAARLERIKREIANGTYDSDEKLEHALDRMLGVLLDT